MPYWQNAFTCNFYLEKRRKTKTRLVVRLAHSDKLQMFQNIIQAKKCVIYAK